MELNKIQKHFKAAIEELTLIAGRNGVLFSLMVQSTERINGNQDIGHRLISAGLPFYDITVKEKPDTHMTCEQYKLNRDNLNDEVSMIMNRERLFYISQAYEVLESYLYNQVSNLIMLSGDFQVFVDPQKNTSTFASTRKALKGLGDRKNNQHLINILRANCDLFALHESSNIYNVDFKHWFIMLSLVRNCVIHNRSEVTKEIKNALPKCYLDRFTIVDKDEMKMLQINFGHCSQLLLDIANYMFFVHKAIIKRCYKIDLNITSVKEIFPDIRFVRLTNDKTEII
jgi:hypothetical protein